MMTYERPRNSRIVRSATDEVSAIRTLLSDIYKDAGDGRTIVREIVQNADDSEGATRVVLILLEHGLPKAEAVNPLLRGPALVAVNDGRFRREDQEGLHRAIGGAKSEDASKIGRFGLGMKSVFHLCEAVLYLGADRGSLRAGVLNPWAGTGEHDDTDPIHPEWDELADGDADHLLAFAREHLTDDFHSGFLSWIPLRQKSHLRQGGNGQTFGLSTIEWTTDMVRRWFGDPRPLRMLLSQCGFLKSIDVRESSSVGRSAHSRILTRAERPDFRPGSWVGRYRAVPDGSAKRLSCRFSGLINGMDHKKTIAVGQETLTWTAGLQAIWQDSDWPIDFVSENGRPRDVRRKALPHAAITVIRPDDRLTPSTISLRWAVFLPLDDRTGTDRRHGVEVARCGSGTGPAWDVILHGYFWPSQDRRSIPGVTDDESPPTGEGAVRVKWNRAVRDDLLLPLVPGVLAQALADVEPEAARTVVGAISRAEMVVRNRRTITGGESLLPVVRHDGVSWESISTEDLDRRSLLSIPDWNSAPSAFRRNFLRCLSTSDVPIVIDGSAPTIGGDPGSWSPDWAKTLLGSLSREDLAAPDSLKWTGALLGHLTHCGNSVDIEVASVIADWLAQRISEGAIPKAGQDLGSDTLTEHRLLWRDLFSRLPEAWCVDVPNQAIDASVELARKGLVGKGFMPVPLKSPQQPARQGTNPDSDRVRAALVELGKLLQEDPTSSLRRSRLMLAESLLVLMGHGGLKDDTGLLVLPLLRAQGQPRGADSAWSVASLREKFEAKRVFSRDVPEQEGEEAVEFVTDAKAASRDLAQALGETVFLVDGPVGALEGVPVPTGSALAAALLEGPDAVAESAEDRRPLISRLSKQGTPDPAVRAALRILLSGRRVSASQEHLDEPLFYVRSDDKDLEGRSRTLLLLSKAAQRPWAVVPGCLAGSMPADLLHTLGVRVIDDSVLREIAQEIIDSRTAWDEIRLVDSDCIHLIQALSPRSGQPDTLWRSLPLHRFVGGERGPLTGRELRVQAGSQLPPELSGEVRLLDPDKGTEDLYLRVETLSPEGILKKALEATDPHRFCSLVLELLVTSEGVCNLHPFEGNPALLTSIRTRRWLSLEEDIGVSPSNALLLTPPLPDLAQPLAEAGILGESYFPGQLGSSVREIAMVVLHELHKATGPEAWIKRLAKAVLGEKLADFKNGRYLLLPRPTDVDARLLEDGLNAGLGECHDGWRLLGTAHQVAGSAGSPLSESILGLARALCGPVPADSQVQVLNKVAEARPGQDTSSGKAHRALLKAFSKTNEFRAQVLPFIALPTQDGQWHKADQIARSASGVARSHRLRVDLRDIFHLDDSEPIQFPGGVTTAVTGGTVAALRTYFEGWRGRVPDAAIGAFLSVIGEIGNVTGQTVRDLASEWLGGEYTVAKIRDELGIEDREVFLFVAGRVVGDDDFRALNLLDQEARFASDDGKDSVFAVDPEPRSSGIVGRFWQIIFRDVKPVTRTRDELLDRLYGSLRWWTDRIYHLDGAKVEKWWSAWGTGSQAAVGPVRASVLAHLPLTLRQLDVSQIADLHQAVSRAERAQRDREQAIASQVKQAFDQERAALVGLSRLVESEEYHLPLLSRVRARMETYGYRPASTLIELVQNADDALVQAAEIERLRRAPEAASRLIIRVQEEAGRKVIYVLHFGRAINDTGGSAFPSGKERQWDQDLYFMTLMNLSTKPGESYAQGSVGATTGRFGLGFKSVHLLTDDVEVASGFVAFRIAAGLLPVEMTPPNHPDLIALEGDGVTRRATRFRLPLTADGPSLDTIFSSFNVARPLIPAFAREIKEVIVEGGPNPGRSSFYRKSVEGAPGWSVGRDEVHIAGEPWQLLRFRPSDGGRDLGSTAVVVGILHGLPRRFPETMPFLWCVAPTCEDWGCGYAVNGPFKMHPGRSHVLLDTNQTKRVVVDLGQALGEGLLSLHDHLLARPEGNHEDGLPSGPQAERFLSELWKTLAAGVRQGDPERAHFMRQLHGLERGVSRWMMNRSVVPSGLGKPFSERLPPLSERCVRMASSALTEPTVMAALSEIPDLAEEVALLTVVSPEIARILEPLDVKVKLMTASDLLRQLVDVRWSHFVAASRFHQLVPVLKEDVYRIIDVERSPWSAELRARSSDGNTALLNQLLLPVSAISKGDADEEEENMRASFAPSMNLLDAEYLRNDDDARAYRRLRGSYRLGAEVVAGWFDGLVGLKRARGVEYLARGRLADDVSRHLRNPDRVSGSWYRDPEEVDQALASATVTQQERKMVVLRLFPDRLTDRPEVTPPQPPPPPDPRRLSEDRGRRLLIRLYDLWSDASYREAQVLQWRDHWYPRQPEAWTDDRIHRALKMHPENETDANDAWMILLTLSTTQGLGRAIPGQHRGFIEALLERQVEGISWWNLLFSRTTSGVDWFRVLEEWSRRRDASRTPYDHWLSTLPELYPAWRWLVDYRDLLLAADRRDTVGPELLRPRVDPEQERGGIDAPALPQIRLHWLLRELLRLGILQATNALSPLAWPKSGRLVLVMQLLGARGLEGLNSYRFSEEVWRFVGLNLGPDRDASFFGCYDIPLISADFRRMIEDEFSGEDRPLVASESWDDNGDSSPTIPGMEESCT